MRFFLSVVVLVAAGIFSGVYYFVTVDAQPSERLVLPQPPLETAVLFENQANQEPISERTALPEGGDAEVRGITDRGGVNPVRIEETVALPIAETSALSPAPDSGAVYRKALATLFWAGEPPGSDNGFITNEESAWDSAWQKSYGGVDDPAQRCGYRPCAFLPQENPFYFALPYNDLDEAGRRKASAQNIPWFAERSGRTSVVKNTWIEITYQNERCYAQWEDVGPFDSDDFDYVFGGAPPRNTDGLGAGLDVSPAVRDCLGLKSNDEVRWRFVSEPAVPAGPWKETVTASDVSW
jgi:hypothetical protein